MMSGSAPLQRNEPDGVSGNVAAKRRQPPARNEPDGALGKPTAGAVDLFAQRGTNPMGLWVKSSPAEAGTHGVIERRRGTNPMGLWVRSLAVQSAVRPVPNEPDGALGKV